MKNQSAETGSDKKVALLYGMQRSGTNYLEEVLRRNFRNIGFSDQNQSRCLPTHKHFRLYEEKAVIPDPRYMNSFTYGSFNDFRQHAEQVAERDVSLFIVCMKDPYSWYLSYGKHARKNRITGFKKSLNTHFLIDYNLFYRKWLDFSREAPDDVMILRYEDLIGDLAGSLNKIAQKFKLERPADIPVNPTRVRMSRTFTKARSSYYREKKYLDEISGKEKSVIRHLLDPELIAMTGYEIITQAP